MSTKTVRIESALRAEQVLVTAIDGKTTEPTVVTIHKTGPNVFTILRADGKFTEVKGSTTVTYTADLPEGTPVAACTREGHGAKAQRPGGIWFCRTCYREQQAAYRARKRGEVPTRAQAKAARTEVAVAASLRVAERTAEQLRAISLRTVARMAGVSDEYREQRFAAVAAQYGMTVEQATEAVAAL